MKFSKLFLSALLPAALLSGCSGNTDIDDVTDKVEDQIEDAQEVAFTIGKESSGTKAFRLDNEIGSTINDLYISETGLSSNVNVLPENWKNGKVIVWNLAVTEGTTYTLRVDTDNTSYSFNNVDLSDVDVSEDMELTMETDSVELEYTSLKTKAEVKVIAETTPATDTDEVQPTEAEETVVDEENYDAAQGVYDQGTDDYQYDSSYTEEPSYSYDYGYDYGSGTEGTGGYDTTLPDQNQDSCLGEDALIQY